MESGKTIDEALKKLLELSSKKGFLLFDDIYDAADKWNLSIREVDYLSNSIATHGVLVYDEAPITQNKDYDDYRDFAQSDYDEIFHRIIQLDPGLSEFIEEVSNIVPPQAGEVNRLKYQVIEGNSYARTRMIQMHLRLAVKIALQKAMIYDFDIEEVLQEACIGLIYAVDRYNPDSGDPFGPYASLWILQNINRMLPTKRPLVYYPYHQRENYFKTYPLLKQMGCHGCEDLWHCPIVRERLCQRLNLPENQINDSINMSMPLDSYEEIYCKWIKYYYADDEQEVNGERDTAIFPELFYYCPSNGNRDPASLSASINTVLQTLSEKERYVIEQRYGLIDGKSKTLEEVGSSMNVTRERIRQIESKALRKLRLSSNTSILEEYATWRT